MGTRGLAARRLGGRVEGELSAYYCVKYSTLLVSNLL